MWWDKFERLLNESFQTYDRCENRKVYYDPMNLLILTKKINADFLKQVKASLNLELSKVPITITYEESLHAFCNQVNQKFPPGITQAPVHRRSINQVNPRQRGFNNLDVVLLTVSEIILMTEWSSVLKSHI